jgi:hypothetical protein
VLPPKGWVPDKVGSGKNASVSGAEVGDSDEIGLVRAQSWADFVNGGLIGKAVGNLAGTWGARGSKIVGRTGANRQAHGGGKALPLLETDILKGATRTSGKFDLEGGPPNGTVYRSDNTGKVTSYIVYDEKGMALKRVDLSGASHGGVRTPHVVEYGRNTLPDGTIRVHTPKGLPRPANPKEIP